MLRRKKGEAEGELGRGETTSTSTDKVMKCALMKADYSACTKWHQNKYSKRYSWEIISFLISSIYKCHTLYLEEGEYMHVRVRKKECGLPVLSCLIRKACVVTYYQVVPGGNSTCSVASTSCQEVPSTAPWQWARFNNVRMHWMFLAVS